MKSYTYKSSRIHI